ncbi:MAG: ATP phosphoribosyltransferase regulatory subunit [Clostridia bacterium]|nr:ATP phosphoribosyltransferase regulatory subunit [Clostridia bacterium]
MEKMQKTAGSEGALKSLRELYSRYGYARFKMSKFEEYDLYARNKNFLRGDSIITFTGSGGKLMALRPDVTLSIVKNAKNGAAVEKVYYTENVYRESKDSRELSEILQVGLECIGEIDLYQTGEVILLAVQSLAAIGENYILDISHMGLLSGLLDTAGAEGDTRDALIGCIREKNAHGIAAVCAGAGISDDACRRLITAATLYGPMAETIEKLRQISTGKAENDALNELTALYDVLTAAGCADRVNLDLSTVNDMSYYNGIILSGFVEGIPDAILAGGRYDNLLLKMGKTGGAIGFAVYLDLLEHYSCAERGYDADILLLYDENTDAAALTQAVKMLGDSGKTVRAQKRIPEGFRYRQLLTMKDRGLEILETND